MSEQPVIKSKSRTKGYLIIISILVTIAGLMLVYYGIQAYFSTPPYLYKEQYNIVKGTLAKDIKILAAQNISGSVDIYLKEHPDYIFRVNGAAYDAIVDRQKLSREAKTDNKITLSIDGLDYWVKILNSQLISVTTDYLTDYHIIYVYGINYEGKAYLTPEDYIKEEEESRKISIITAIIFGIPTLTAGILMIRRLRKKSVDVIHTSPHITS